MANEADGDFGDVLDIFGQNPRLSKLYTQLCFCFDLPRSDNATRLRTITVLEEGLEILCHAFPWIAGEVDHDIKGVYRIKHDEKPLRLISQDRRSNLPNMGAYHEAGFPFSMLDEATVAACETLPGKSDKISAVLLVKATFIENGLILNFDGQHNCMDIAGQCEVIRLFSKACRNAPFTAEELHTGNLSRHDIVPVDQEDESSTQPSPSTLPCLTPASSVGTTWSYFLFPSSSLQDLKSHASTSVSASPLKIPFISTDDALSALIWQSVTRARIPSLNEPDLSALSTFDRQVNARKALSIPSGYTGNVVHKASVRLPCKEIPELELGVLAAMLRREVQDQGRIARETRVSAGKLRESLEKSSAGGSGGDGERKTGLSAIDFRMSSWAKEECYGFDFGELLGKPVAVRRPGFPAWEGLGYSMPKTLEGDIAVGVCLKRETTERLKADETLSRYGRYVG